MMTMNLRVLAHQGTPGNPKTKPRDLINPNDKGCTLDVDNTVTIYVHDMCICIGPDKTVAVSREGV